MIDPVFEDFLRCLLQELASSDLNHQMLLQYTEGQEKQARLARAIDELIKRGWAKLSEIDYLSITDEGRKQI
jgi:hypothetical protein